MYHNAFLLAWNISAPNNEWASPLTSSTTASFSGERKLAKPLNHFPPIAVFLWQTRCEWFYSIVGALPLWGYALYCDSRFAIKSNYHAILMFIRETNMEMFSALLDTCDTALRVFKCFLKVCVTASTTYLSLTTSREAHAGRFVSYLN